VQRRNRISILATVIVLGWLAVDKTLLRPAPAVADEYHAGVRAASEQLPRYFESWLGEDIPVPVAAAKLLRPNVIVSRRFSNIVTGESVSYLFVQVRDARDTIGHYPPVCYPGQGWTMEEARRTEWEAGERGAVSGMSYRFSQEGLEGGLQIVVDNFLVLPDGTTCRDMDGVESVAQDRLRKLFGTAQVQLIYSAAMPEERRKQITQEFIRYSRDLIDAASSGERYVSQH
jgi:hypothetical protein